MKVDSKGSPVDFPGPAPEYCRRQAQGRACFERSELARGESTHCHMAVIRLVVLITGVLIFALCGTGVHAATYITAPPPDSTVGNRFTISGTKPDDCALTALNVRTESGEFGFLPIDVPARQKSFSVQVDLGHLRHSLGNEPFRPRSGKLLLGLHNSAPDCIEIVEHPVVYQPARHRKTSSRPWLIGGAIVACTAAVLLGWNRARRTRF